MNNTSQHENKRYAKFNLQKTIRVIRVIRG